MGPIEAVKSCFSKFADFKGRASRSEYWWFYLFTVVLYIPVLFLLLIIVSSLLSPGSSAEERGESFAFFNLVVLGVALIPFLAVQVRRLHDVGGSAWYLLLHLFPAIGGIALIVICALPGKPEVNKYGEFKI